MNSWFLIFKGSSLQAFSLTRPNVDPSLKVYEVVQISELEKYKKAYEAAMKSLSEARDKIEELEEIIEDSDSSGIC